MLNSLVLLLQAHQQSFHPVVPFEPGKDQLVAMDFSDANSALTNEVIEDVHLLDIWIQTRLQAHRATYGIGGYAELRNVYARSSLFGSDADAEPRRFHLGVDIWGAAGTPVYAPIGGMVHSFAFNEGEGNYGATIILLHQLNGIPFYTLYGHLSLPDLSITEGQYFNRGEAFAHFGPPAENGNWPPHLHFQIISHLQAYEGDFPGVCRYSEREAYMLNCPNPDLILQMEQYLPSK